MNSVNKKKLIGQLNIYRSVLILLVICVFATILSPSFLSVPICSTCLSRLQWPVSWDAE